MKQVCKVSVAALCCSLAFSAALFAAPAAQAGIAVADALGRRVLLNDTPRRIVFSGKALFMVVDAVYLFPQAMSRVAAMSSTVQGGLSFSDAIDPEAQRKIKLTGGAGAEQIAAANPDLVILKSGMAESLGKSVELLGIPVLYVDFETVDQYKRDLRVLGRVFRDERRAEQLIGLFQQKLDRIDKALAGLAEKEKPRVLMLYYSDKDGAVSFNVPPLGWMQSEMLRRGGGVPVWKDAQLGSGWTKVSLEQIASWNPDQIFLISYASRTSSEAAAMLKADSQWRGLKAVKAGRLYAFPSDYYSWDQPDPRWILGMTWLAAKMHPERFRGLAMLDETRAFYEDFYKLDAAAYDRLVLPHLQGDLP